MANLQQQQQQQHAGGDHPKQGANPMSTSGSFRAPESETPGPGHHPAATTGGPVVAAPPPLLPSFSAACGLVSAPYSCLVLSLHRRHLALAPMFLRRKRSGIRQELDGELLRYSESLHGVPLAYDDIGIVGQHGDIYDDSGYIHLDIQANFVIFQPEPGQRLLGTVNKLGATFVGCLVHGAFNASIPKPSLVSVDVWRDAGPRIGTQLEFQVSQMDADTAGVLLIRGRLDRTRVQELLALGESLEVPEPAELAEPPDQDATDHTPKKKKKKKNKKEADGDVTPELNGEALKKKKKKKEEEDEERGVVGPSPTEVHHHHSDSSGYVSDKPGKKRKARGEDAQTPGGPAAVNGDPQTPGGPAAVNGDPQTPGGPAAVNGDPQTPKAKKKRKSDVQHHQQQQQAA